MAEPMPRWRQIDPMRHARYYVYPVMLPYGKVLVLGGRSGTKGHDMPDSHPMPAHGIGQPAGTMGGGMDGPVAGEVPHDPRAVLEPELFDPDTERWTPVAPMTVDRLYHSCAILLPDGRVATFGNNPMEGMDELRIEIYRPPYLFRGPRPRLDDAPGQVAYGQELDIRSPDAAAVDAAVLIRPTVTTHCVNPEQRCVRLEFRRSGPDQLVASIPANVNVVPPGYYMLFLLAEGVPSVSRMVLVHS
jgi:hypothetical protein